MTGVDYDGDLDSNTDDIDDPSDTAANAATANFSPNGEAETGDNIDQVAATLAGSGLLHRTNAVGGIVDFLIDLGEAADTPKVVADDIVNIAVTLGGINAIGGPATLLVLDKAGLDGTADGGGMAAFSLFAQNIRGQASVTVTSGALTGVSMGARVDGLPKAHFVGAATAGAFVDTVLETTGGTHNPKTFVAGTANAFGMGSNFWFVNFHDAGGFNVLNGQLVSIALSVTVGAASIPAFASVPAGQPALANVVTDDEADIGNLGGSQLDRGSVGFGLTTAASTPSNGTITVKLGTVVLTRAFTATGAAVDLVSATAPGGAGIGGAILSVVGGTNALGSLWAIVIADSAGNGLAASAPAIAPAVVTPTVDVAGQLTFDPVLDAGTLKITPAATAVPGTYTVTLTLATGLVTNDTITFEVVIGGATTTLTHTITDAAGTDITAAPRVGIGEFITIVLTATDANGNPPPNATVVGGAGPNLGLVQVPPATNTAGTSTVVYVAPAATGIVTFNYRIGAVNDTFTVEVGGVGGQLIDGLVADGDTVIDANVGDQVSLTVIATLLGVNTPDAIIRWEATSGSPTPSEGSTGTDGGHTTVVTSTVTGTVTVTATAISEGVNDKVPVPGVESVTFTISFGSSTVVFTTGAQATYQSWESADADSSVFENVAGLVAVWIYDGTNWLIYASDPDAPSNLKMAFVVTSGPPRSILFVVSTGPATLTLN